MSEILSNLPQITVEMNHGLKGYPPIEGFGLNNKNIIGTIVFE